tara:strand:- start:4507 stop:6432 length:1926 start_codon:yes stop_codon:yes gene_type:complete
MAEWYFNQRPQGVPTRDSISGAFFTDEVINDFAGALIREGTQNSRDNRLDENEPVKIRLTIGNTDFVNSNLDRDLWEHIEAAPDGGKQAASHREDHQCRYLVIEDFNATGLRGDVRNDRLRDADGKPKDNNEWNFFFYAEGISSKRHGKLGSWGVGKYAFLDASYINSIFAYTVRTDERNPGPYLLGRSVIKSHTIDDVEFTQDGFWAHRIEADDGVGVIHEPFDSETEEMRSFLNTFKISRGNSDSGLSIVIPYIAEQLDCEQLIQVVLSNYAMMIAWGELEIEIQDAEGERYEFTAENIHDQLKEKGEENPDLAELLPELEICLTGREIKKEDLVIISRPSLSGQPSWNDENGLWLNEKEREKFVQKLDAGEVVGVSVPVYINEREKSNDTGLWSQFTIYFKQSDTEQKFSGRFFRRGLWISAETYALRDLRSLVYIDSQELSDFLVDAEGPSHTHWRHAEEKFKDKYMYGPTWLRLIKNAPSKILQLVKNTGENEDYNLAKNFFSLASTEEDNENKGDDSGSTGEDETDGPIIVLPPSKKDLNFTKLSNGIRCTVNDEKFKNGDSVSFIVSYAGAGWKSCDFDFGLNPSLIQITGGTIIDKVNNNFSVKVDDVEKFKVEVAGFDVNRDLVVTTSIERI